MAGEACMARGCAWLGSMHSQWGVCGWGVCVAGDMCGRGPPGRYYR